MILLSAWPFSHLSIGQILARKWYLEGLRTLDDVRDRKNDIKLSPHQEVGMISRLVLLGCLVMGPTL